MSTTEQSDPMNEREENKQVVEGLTRLGFKIHKPKTTEKPIHIEERQEDGTATDKWVFPGRTNPDYDRLKALVEKHANGTTPPDVKITTDADGCIHIKSGPWQYKPHVISEADTKRAPPRLDQSDKKQAELGPLETIDKAWKQAQAEM